MTNNTQDRIVHPNTDTAPAGTNIVQFDGVNFQDGSYESARAGYIKQYFRRDNGVEISVFSHVDPMTDTVTDRFYYYTAKQRRRSKPIYTSALEAARAALKNQ